MTQGKAVTYRVPTWGRVLLYGFFLAVMAIILAGQMTKLVPGGLGLTISRNSEGFLMLLAVCFWIDVVHPRLDRSARSWAIVLGVGVLLLVGGLLLRQAPFVSRVVTLNEAVIGLGVILPYLHLRRPVSRWALVLPIAGVVIPAIGGSNTFTTDMAEAFGGMVLFPLVVDVIDRGLLLDRVARPRRNIVAAVALLLVILVVHVVTPHHPLGIVPNVLYYLQRATEMFIAAAVVLLYYALREPVEVGASQSADTTASRV